MRRRLARGLLLLLAVGACACELGSDQADESPAMLSPESFAVVGQEKLALDLLKPFPPPEREKMAKAVVRDALFARELKTSHSHWTHAVERSVLGRAMLEQFERTALSDQPVAQADLEQHRSRNWLFLDRPRAVRAYEALIPVGNAMEDEAAHRLAERVHEMALETRYPEDFAERLSTLQEQHPELQTNELPPVAADGRIVPVLPLDMRYREAPAFYGPALAPLESVGDVTDVVGSGRGYHVLMALEIVPALRPSDEEVGQLLRQGVAAQRMEPQVQALEQKGQALVLRSKRDLGPLLRMVWQQQ